MLVPVVAGTDGPYRHRGGSRLAGNINEHWDDIRSGWHVLFFV